jgi:pSer/pThr/pTyr-binding forkhead associated (FHA) protein
MSLELRQRDTLVGRHSDADVRLPLPDVSRRHCRFVHDQGRWEVVDLNSLNGVFVNDEAVQDRRELHHRDRVRIGGFTFEVDMHPGEQTVGLAAGEVGDSGEVLRSIAEALPSPQTLPEVPQRRAS